MERSGAHHDYDEDQRNKSIARTILMSLLAEPPQLLFATCPYYYEVHERRCQGPDRERLCTSPSLELIEPDEVSCCVEGRQEGLNVIAGLAGEAGSIEGSQDCL